MPQGRGLASTLERAGPEGLRRLPSDHLELDLYTVSHWSGSWRCGNELGEEGVRDTLEYVFDVTSIGSGPALLAFIDSFHRQPFHARAGTPRTF